MKWRWVNAKSIFYFRWTISLNICLTLSTWSLNHFIIFSVFVLYLPFLTSRSRSFSLGWVSARFRKMTNSAVSQSVGGTQWVSQWPPACCYNTAWPPEPSSPLWARHPVLVLKHTHTHLYNNQKNNHTQKPLSRDWGGCSIFFIRANASLKGTLAWEWERQSLACERTR